jgi:DNA topoisomerase-1
MQKRHVTLEPGHVIRFDYPAKSGRRQIRSVVDPGVYDVVAALKARRSGGRELLAFELDGAWFDVKSADINAYIKEATGGDFSAKDFRTWTGTVLAAVGLATSGAVARSPTARRRAVTRVIKEVAHYLGNTPAVARASYIDPRVFDRYLSGVTIGGALAGIGEVSEVGEPAFQGAVEEAVLDLLEDERSDAIENVA